ncbi:MAG: hypothetical protein MUD03_08640 [Pirellula sp.]|nr:hypothetical protein [Pirellula sp.]
MSVNLGSKELSQHETIVTGAARFEQPKLISRVDAARYFASFSNPTLAW